MKKLDNYIFKLEYEYIFYVHFCYHEAFWKQLIKNGNKLKAINLFYKFKLELKIKENGDPFYILIIALMNCTPIVYGRKLWVAGLSRVLIFPINFKKQVYIVINWIIKHLKGKQKNIKMPLLADLLILCLNCKGEIWKKKIELYELGRENRLFFKYLK